MAMLRFDSIVGALLVASFTNMQNPGHSATRFALRTKEGKLKQRKKIKGEDEPLEFTLGWVGRDGESSTFVLSLQITHHMQLVSPCRKSNFEPQNKQTIKQTNELTY